MIGIGAAFAAIKVLAKIRVPAWLPWALLAVCVTLGVSHWYTYNKAYTRGDTNGAARVQGLWVAAALESSKAINELETAYRKREQQMQRDNQEISDELHTQLDQTRTEYILAVDAARSGTAVLRKQFRGCATDLSSTSGDPAGAGRDDGAPENGLRGEDVEPFLHLAAEANANAHTLIACQDRSAMLERELGKLQVKP